MPHPMLVLFLVAYSLLHSMLAAQAWKDWLTRHLGAQRMRAYRLFYNVVAVVTLLPLPLLLALLPDQTLYTVPPPWRWLLLLGQAMAALALLLALRQTDSAHFLGLAQLGQRADAPAAPPDFVNSGFYGYVRHPLYTFGLLFMWLSPVMTVNLLTTYGLFSIYMYVATFHEERRLIAEFGDRYRSYQRHVGRFVPRLARRSARTSDQQ